jgi:adenosylhomocysteine nucleosidase
MSANAASISPCVVFALRRESMYFRRAFPFQTLFPGAPCLAEFRQPRGSRFHRCTPTLLMLETGVGAAAMETAVRWCLSGPRFGDESYRPPFLLSVGFSGALQPEQRVGDLVMATEVVDSQGNGWPASFPLSLDNHEIAAGRLLSMPKLVGDPCEKRRLGRHYGALAVDMESAVAAQLCCQHKIPFACLRVISDDCHTALSSHLLDLLRQGRVSLWRLAAKILRHPKLIGEFWRLASNTRRASRQLLGPLARLQDGPNGKQPSQNSLPLFDNKS